jgi:hypothetical protein
LIKAAARRPQEKWKKMEKFGKFSSTRIIYLETNSHGPNPIDATDEKSGRCKESEVIDDKDNCGPSGMQHLNILPTKCKAFLFDMGIFTASVFLSNEVGELATKYQVWHNQTAKENQSAGRPASQITTGCACIYLIKMRKKIRDSLKAENGSVRGESRQGQSGMAKDFDPHNNANQTHKVQAGSTVVKELRSTSSGFSLKPEFEALCCSCGSREA